MRPSIYSHFSHIIRLKPTLDYNVKLACGNASQAPQPFPKSETPIMGCESYTGSQYNDCINSQLNGTGTGTGNTDLSGCGVLKDCGTSNQRTRVDNGVSQSSNNGDDGSSGNNGANSDLNGCGVLKDCGPSNQGNGGGSGNSEASQ